LAARAIQSVEDGAVLATEAESVHEKVTEVPIPATDEVQPPIEGEEPVVQTVSAPTLGASKAAASIAQGPEAT
jgi:hypothetical protein